MLSLSTEIFIGFGQCKECCRWKVGAVPAMIQCSWLALPKASHVLAQLVCVSTNILLNISPAKIQLQPKTHFLIFCAVLLLSFHCLLFPIPPPLVPPPPKKEKEKRGLCMCLGSIFYSGKYQGTELQTPKGVKTSLPYVSSSWVCIVFPIVKLWPRSETPRGYPLQCKQYKTNYFSHYQ